MVAMIYRGCDELPEMFPLDDERLHKIIDEVIEIAEYSRSFPICLWIHGDATSQAFLDKRRAPLPSSEEIEHLMNLPHYKQLESDRLPYCHDTEKLALKRYRRELAAFNKRKKQNKTLHTNL